MRGWIILGAAVASAAFGSAGAQETQDQAGPICGSAAILGVSLPPIEDEGGCGIARPVQVRSVAGVALTPEPTLTCGTARALAVWVAREAKPAVALRGARLEGLEIAASYVCRNINRATEGELSEHARGRAIDISALRLADGRSIRVLDGWDAGPLPGLLPWVHAGACGRFTTTLGPGSDGFHEDHLHFDTAPRGSLYCR